MLLELYGFSRAVPPGVNNTSYVFRVSVDYQVRDKGRKVSLIVKDPIMEGPISEITEQCDFFSMESTFYVKVMPLLSRLLNENIGPEAFYSSVPNVLVLEDLKEKGFRMCDRHTQLDFLQCESVIKTLAKFHAASVACHRDSPDVISEVSKEAIYTKSATFETLIKPWIEDSVAATVETITEMRLGNEAEDLFKNRAETASDIMIRHCTPKRNKLNVLNHGDLWLNNIFFKYNSPQGDVEDVKLVDYQLRRYAPPTGDLMYFIWTSANEQVREKKLPELCEIYRTTLNDTLEQLECSERLTEEEFRRDLREATDLAVVLVAHILPLTASDTEATPQVETQSKRLMDAFGGKKHLYGGKYFRALLPKVVKHLKAWEAHFK